MSVTAVTPTVDIPTAPPALAPVRVEPPLAINIHPGARSVFSDCLTAIREARVWAETCSDITTEVGDELRRISETRAALVNEMERSLFHGVTHLMFGPPVDGTLHIYGESPLSFFWRFDTGYCGGLIYHRSHSPDAAGGPVGTWSIHT